MKRLTRRESQVAALIGAGLSNQDVATATGLTEGTIKVYLTRMYAKLELNRGNQRVRLARIEWEKENTPRD